MRRDWFLLIFQPQPQLALFCPRTLVLNSDCYTPCSNPCLLVLNTFPCGVSSNVFFHVKFDESPVFLPSRKSPIQEKQEVYFVLSFKPSPLSLTFPWALFSLSVTALGPIHRPKCLLESQLNHSFKKSLTNF